MVITSYNLQPVKGVGVAKCDSPILLYYEMVKKRDIERDV